MVAELNPKVGAAAQRLARCPELPLLRLKRFSRLPNPVFGGLWGLLVFLIVIVPFFTLDMNAGQQREVLGSALFFSASIAILTGGAAPVFYGAAGDLRRLGAVLGIADELHEDLVRSLTRATRAQIVTTLCIGILGGCMHSFLLGHFRLPEFVLIPQLFGTVTLWVFMVTTLTKLVINALVFSRLGAVAEPDLLRPSRHAPFGTAALRPALFIVGTLCAYVLLFIGDDQPMDDAVWIGVAVSLVTLVGILSLPLGGIRRRISQRREEILADLDDRLEALADTNLASVPADTLRDMDTILDMRERVAQAPGWPLDLAGVRRILLYIVLPPLTWAAAALVEMLVDTLV